MYSGAISIHSKDIGATHELVGPAKSQKCGQERDIGAASAKYRIVLVHILLEKRCLIKLSESIEGRRHQVVRVNEPVEERAPQGIQPDHLVLAEHVDEVGEHDVDRERSKRDDLAYALLRVFLDTAICGA